MTSVLAKRMWPHSADFRFKNVFGHRIRQKSALRSLILFASTEVMHRPRSDFPLHFDVKKIYKIRWLSTTLLERWPQVCRIKITFSELLPNNWFVSTKTNSMTCFVNQITARTFVRTKSNPAN